MIDLNSKNFERGGYDEKCLYKGISVQRFAKMQVVVIWKNNGLEFSGGAVG